VELQILTGEMFFILLSGIHAMRRLGDQANSNARFARASAFGMRLSQRHQHVPETINPLWRKAFTFVIQSYNNSSSRRDPRILSQCA
jgi:hypothetical protein